MNITSINIIKYLTNGVSTVSALMDAVGTKEWQMNSNLKKLSELDYITRDGGTVKLTNNLKSAILKELVKKTNIEKILCGANETVFSYLDELISINEIILKTELSQSTVYRAISDFESIGAVIKIEEKIKTNPSNAQLALLANSLKAEREHLYESDAEILFQDSSKILTKIQCGKLTAGELTGFSLFTEYGVEYGMIFDYYIKQKAPMDIQHVLIHAVFDAQRNLDKHGMTMAMIFYLKNRNRMDIINLRQIADTFKIAHVWIDIEGYLRNCTLKNPNLFLPKGEFIEKANLYDIPPSLYVSPDRYPNLFEEIGKRLLKSTRVFVVVDENIQIKGFESRAKDIVVQTKDDCDSIMNALAEISYHSKENSEFSKEDSRLAPSIIMQYNASQINLFTKKILKTLSLSSKMISRANFTNFGNLHLGILKNEDVFLLKSVTSREGDIQDMAALINPNYFQSDGYQQTDFDWEIVWDEILNSESSIQNFIETVYENIEWLIQQTGIKSPIRNKLQRLFLDKQINKLLCKDSISIKFIVEQLIDERISEQTIRNRIDALVKQNILEKIFADNKVKIQYVNK